MNNKARDTLLDGFRRFEDLPPNSLCRFYPIPDYGKMLDIQIDYTKKNFDHLPAISIPSTTWITSTLDKLLGRWIKLSKYISKPRGCQTLALLFLKTKSCGMTNIFGISTQECSVGSIWNITQNYSSFISQSSPPCSNNSSSPNRLILPQRSGLYPDVRPSYHMFTLRIPFIFVELLNDYPTWMLRDEMHLSELIQNYCKDNLTITRLIPTHSDNIFIISYSQFFQTEKQCAKLMRKILKNPREIESFSPMRVGFEASPKIEGFFTTFDVKYF